MELKRLKFEVFGKVQGVFFRASTQEFANSIGIRGWVQNTQRSTVIGEGEGNAEQVDKFKY